MRNFPKPATMHLLHTWQSWWDPRDPQQVRFPRLPEQLHRRLRHRNRPRRAVCCPGTASSAGACAWSAADSTEQALRAAGSARRPIVIVYTLNTVHRKILARLSPDTRWTKFRPGRSAAGTSSTSACRRAWSIYSLASPTSYAYCPCFFALAK